MGKRGKPQDGRSRSSDERGPKDRPEALPGHQSDDDAWFETALGSALQSLDAMSDEHKSAPSLDNLRAMIGTHRTHNKQKLWKGLALLWGAGIIVSGLMMAAWLYDMRWLIAAQAGILVCALSFVAIIALKREDGRWTN